MAAKAAPPDTTDTIQVHTMTKGTRSLNVLRRVMEGIVRAGPLLWVGIVFAMTAFTPFVTSFSNADVEARIAAGAAGFAMAGLA